MYFEFLLRRAHSRSRVERRYWSGVSLYSFTTCSNSVTVGTMGPIGSGLPQLGFPRLLAMNYASVHGFKLLTKLDSDGLAKDSNPCPDSQINRQKETAGAELAEDQSRPELHDSTSLCRKVNDKSGACF